ncbi:MAG: DUF3892 domain-containing protein [Lachnospiraceae bacterium]|nr:DUF3892 domain-containing protein [Lachnospiraceae bacterium]
MNLEENTGISFAANTLDDIPQPKADAKEIIGLVKKGSKITGYQLSDQRIVSREEGVALAKAGEIAGVGVAHRKDTEYLKSIPDGTDNNNLSHLPTVKASIQ